MCSLTKDEGNSYFTETDTKFEEKLVILITLSSHVVTNTEHRLHINGESTFRLANNTNLTFPPSHTRRHTPQPQYTVSHFPARNKKKASEKKNVETTNGTNFQITVRDK